MTIKDFTVGQTAYTYSKRRGQETVQEVTVKKIGRVYVTIGDGPGSLHETLDRLLWRYSAEHGLASGWDHSRFNYRIYRRMDNGKFALDCNDACKYQGAVYFCDEATARSAIKEVIKPFMAEHPDFIW